MRKYSQTPTATPALNDINFSKYGTQMNSPIKTLKKEKASPIRQPAPEFVQLMELY